MVGTNDLEKAKRFYDAVLGALGYMPSCNATAIASDMFTLKRLAGSWNSRPPSGPMSSHLSDANIGSASCRHEWLARSFTVRGIPWTSR